MEEGRGHRCTISYDFVCSLCNGRVHMHKANPRGGWWPRD